MTVRCEFVNGFCVIQGGYFREIMPSEVVTLAVSTGIGFSVLAGIISGVCYIVAHGINKCKRNRKTAREWYCDVCGGYLRSIEGILEGDKVVTCIRCETRVCKVRCSSQDHTVGGWICLICLRQPDAWYKGILKIMQPSRGNSSTMNAESINEIAEDIEAIQKKEKEQVRDFIERLVTTMLGGNVDDASVTKLYNDKHYDAIFTRYHQDLSTALTDLGSALHISIANLPITGQSPCTAHAALKELIQRLIREALDLPSLKKAEEQSNVPAVETDRTYEDLLATAILNKVISNSQLKAPSSSANSVSSRVSTSSRNRDEKEYFFGEETLDNKWKTTDLDSTSVSSLEEWLHSDSSLGSKKFVDKVTLTIKQNIEEVSGTDSEREDDEEEDPEYFRTPSSLLNPDDDPNWFLQKRRFQGGHSAVPVPMLVPNPTTEAKVLIGDKELDDTSDLSDVASDYGETESIPGRNSLLIESKTIIGGKNYLRGLSEEAKSDDETSGDSGVKEVKDLGDCYDEPISIVEIVKTDIALDDDNVEDASILSIYSNTEKDSEYTERYASLPRTVMKTPTPAARTRAKIQTEEPLAAYEVINNVKNEVHTDSEKEELDEVDGPQDNTEFEGSYSKKEREKWKHAVEMKNNPYSKENIERRLSASSGSVNSLFGRDYYARQASKPAGVKKPLEEEVPNGYSPTPNQETSDDESETVFIAKPVLAVVETTDEEVLDSIRTEPDSLPQPQEMPSMNDLTSDSDLSYVNCYDVEHSQIYRKSPNDDKENDEGTPRGLSYKTCEPLFRTNEAKYDENYNIEKDKHYQQEIITVPLSKPEVLKENRHVYKKSISVYHPPVPKHSTLKRLRSESDLVDSFDAPATVIPRRKDNTLISKIYASPNVRSFALSARDQLPVELESETIKPKSAELNKDQRLYNSYDDLLLSDTSLEFSYAPPRIQKKSFTSSEEDFLDASSSKVDSQTEISKPMAIVRGGIGKLEGAENAAQKGELLIVHPSENTEKSTEQQEIEELKEMNVVTNTLKRISKTVGHATTVRKVRPSDSKQEEKKITPEDEIKEMSEFGSVKELMKKFEQKDASKRDKPICSLTARSLSSKTREELKQ